MSWHDLLMDAAAGDPGELGEAAALDQLGGVTDRFGTRVSLGEPVEFVDGVSIWSKRVGAYLAGVETDGRALISFNDGRAGIAIDPRALRAVGTNERRA